MNKLFLLISFFVLSVFKLSFASHNIQELLQINSANELEAFIKLNKDPKIKEIIHDYHSELLGAMQRSSHVKAVIKTIKQSPGAYTRINTTPERIKNMIGKELPIFDTLTMVTTKIKGGKAHDHRSANEDPYNEEFLEHLSFISTLETLYLESKNVEDSWMKHLMKFKHLQKLTIIGFGRLGDTSLAILKDLKTASPKLTTLELAYFRKATDKGLEMLADLNKLEKFTFRGSNVLGHGFSKFEGWTHLKSINFHSNSLDDKGFAYVCNNFPNLEFIKLWHSQKITNASSNNLTRLTNLKGIEISSRAATAELFSEMNKIPLEYAAFEYGINKPALKIVEYIKSTPSLRRLKLDVEFFSDDELKSLSEATHVEEIVFNKLSLSNDNLEILKHFHYLENVKIAEYRKGFRYTDESKANVKSILPDMNIVFIP